MISKSLLTIVLMTGSQLLSFSVIVVIIGTLRSVPPDHCVVAAVFEAWGASLTAWPCGPSGHGSHVAFGLPRHF